MHCLYPLKADIDKVAVYFKDKNNIAAVYLFGSASKENTHTKSDLDVAVMFKTYIAEREGLAFLNYVADMEAIGSRTVDLVCFNTADPLLKQQIMKHGKILIENAPIIRVHLMVRAMIDYEDYKRQLGLSFRKMRQELHGSE